MDVANTRLPDRTAGTRFCRYEFKYRLPRGMAAAVRSCVVPHLPHDLYSQPAPDHHYDIVSLYLDSADLRLCRESLEGHKNRFKLRIRGYDDDSDHPVFLELKRRINTVIMKDRVATSRRTLADLATAQGRCIFDDGARQFGLYLQCLAAQPQTLVRYRREAFEGQGPSRVRITFDRGLSCRRTQDWTVSLGGCGWRSVLGDEVVMEIKFDGRFPVWLQALVRRFQLQARSVSKYALSMQHGMPAARGLLSAAGVG